MSTLIDAGFQRRSRGYLVQNGAASEAFMFKKPQLAEIISLLRERGVWLYHACQYKDFLSYLSLGGIPSRQLLEDESMGFTPFETDGTDRDNSVWDKVFVNLQDFGEWFARGKGSTPNPYGPILLLLQPEALLDADDVAICLRSAGAPGFDRHAESLSTRADVDFLFQHPANVGPPQSTWIKFGATLATELGRKATSVEISSTFPERRMDLHHLLAITVEDMQIGGDALTRWVSDAVRNARRVSRVSTRKVYAPGRREALQDLIDAIGLGMATVEELTRHQNRELATWAQGVASGSKQLRQNYERFRTYVEAGTIDIILEQARSEERLIHLVDGSALGIEREEEGVEAREEAYQEALDDLMDDQNDWARSHDDGWFYED